MSVCVCEAVCVNGRECVWGVNALYIVCEHVNV